MINNIKDNIDSAKDSFLRKQVQRRPRLAVFIKMVIGFARDMSKDDVGLYAAQSAFFAVLSAVPFLMLVILCAKYFVDVNIVAVTDSIRKAFPAPVSTYIVGIIAEVFYRSQSTALLSATVITTLWTSSRGTMSVYTGFNRIFGYVKRRNWLFSRVASFFYNLMFIAVIVATVVVLVFGNAILTFFDTEYILAHYIIMVLFELKFPIFFVVFVLGFAAMYTYLPQRKTKYRSQLPGAVATAAGWLGFSYLFSLYIMYFSKYSYLYGSLAAIVLLMLWVYFCVYMLLIGAEINKHIENGYFRLIKRRILRVYKLKSNKGKTKK